MSRRKLQTRVLNGILCTYVPLTKLFLCPAFFFLAGGNMERFHCYPAEERPQFAGVHRCWLNWTCPGATTTCRDRRCWWVQEQEIPLLLFFVASRVPVNVYLYDFHARFTQFNRKVSASNLWRGGGLLCVSEFPNDWELEIINIITISSRGNLRGWQIFAIWLRWNYWRWSIACEQNIGICHWRRRTGNGKYSTFRIFDTTCSSYFS